MVPDSIGADGESLCDIISGEQRFRFYFSASDKSFSVSSVKLGQAKLWNRDLASQFSSTASEEFVPGIGISPLLLVGGTWHEPWNTSSLFH